MESITGNSIFLLAFQSFGVAGVVTLVLSGCAQQETQEGSRQEIIYDYGTPMNRPNLIYDDFPAIGIGIPGDRFMAAADGTVDFVASSEDLEWILIYHGRGNDGLHRRTGYLHHQDVFVKKGDRVTRGQVIGIVGGRKQNFLAFTIATSPENVSGPSSAWIYENPHDYWYDGPGRITCFDPEKFYPKNLPLKLIWPLTCR